MDGMVWYRIGHGYLIEVVSLPHVAIVFAGSFPERFPFFLLPGVLLVLF